MVGAVLAYLRLAHWWHAVWYDLWVVSSLAACIAPCLGGCFLVPRAVWLACVGRLAFLVRVCLRCFPALVSDCLYMPNHCVSLQQFKQYNTFDAYQSFIRSPGNHLLPPIDAYILTRCYDTLSCNTCGAMSGPQTAYNSH